jgi:hypothetical protein
MKSPMRVFLSFLLLVLSANLRAQKAPNYFHSISPNDVVLAESARREFEPLQYAAFTVDYEAMVAHLRNAPKAFSADAQKRVCLVTLP